MSRSGYNDGCESAALWRGQVASAIRGRRGQAFLREMLATLDEMPEKRLITEELRQDGEVCALGAVGARRGVALEGLDPYDYDRLAAIFGIARQLIQEIEYVNDEDYWRATPEQRYQHVPHLGHGEHQDMRELGTMSSPIIRDLYEYAAIKYPAVAEHLARLDQEIADHQTASLNLLQTRLEVLRNLHEGKGLAAIVIPGPPRTNEELISRPSSTRPVANYRAWSERGCGNREG